MKVIQTTYADSDQDTLEEYNNEYGEQLRVNATQLFELAIP